MARDSGFLNEYFTITKGQKIDLFYYMIIERGIEDLPEDVILRILDRELDRR